MPARLLLSMVDLARLVAGGLRGRAREVACAGDGAEAMRIDLRGIRLAEWLPRIDVPVRVTWALAAERRRLRIDARVRLTGLASLLLVPGQHLGGGRMAIDALVDALGLDAAVVARDNTGIDLDLARLAGWRLTRLAVADGADPGLAGTFEPT